MKCFAPPIYVIPWIYSSVYFIFCLYFCNYSVDEDVSILKNTRIFTQGLLYNSRRISKLILRGNFEQIISPDGIDGNNNFNKLVTFTNNQLTNVLSNTLNTTLNDIATVALNSPKNFLKNLVCFAPNVMRLLRSKQEPKNRARLKKRIVNLQYTLGK